MPNIIDYSIASSEQIEGALCKQLENIRLARNITQAQLARKAGVSLRTIGRLEKGQGVSLDTLIRVLTALGLQQNLQNFLPDPTIRPFERIHTGGTERLRARPKAIHEKKTAWVWGDELT
jgi:transcriptional regulator with XRE-family HTH domain